MLKDLIHGARTLMRDKGWTAVVVLSLALGIGANTALFSAVNSLFLKKLDLFFFKVVVVMMVPLVKRPHRSAPF